VAKPLLVEIFGDASQYHRTLDKAAGKTKRFGAAAKIAGGLLVTGLAVGIEQSVKAAVHAEASQARLSQAFRDQHIAIAPLRDEIDKLEASGRKLGFTDEQQKQALGSLIVSTGNYAQAARQMAIAEDLARFKSVDLESATKALTMAHAGSLRPLKQLGIDIPKVTTAQDALKRAVKDHTTAAYANALAIAKAQDKQATFANVLDTVTKKVHGQGQAFANTAQGQMQVFNAELEHLKVSLGTKLLPALVSVIGALNNIVGKLQAANDWLGKFGANKGVLTYLKELYAAIRGSGEIQHLVAGLQAIWRWANAAASAIGSLVSAIGRIHMPSLHIPNIHIPGIGKAAGGPVAGMTPYMVGERGPEMFVPGRSGTIVPNGALGGGGGGTIVLNFPNYAGDPGMLARLIRNEVQKIRKNGGKF
jgi:hypothetical protein